MHQSVLDRSNRVRRALGHFYARQHAAAGHVVWVYAITDDLVPDQLAGLTGVGGEEVRAVSEAGPYVCNRSGKMIVSPTPRA